MKGMHIRGVVGGKGDEMGVKSNSSEQIGSMCLMLGVSLPITISSQNSTKGTSSRFGATNVSSFDLRSEASSKALTSTLEVSPISADYYYIPKCVGYELEVIGKLEVVQDLGLPYVIIPYCYDLVCFSYVSTCNVLF